MKDITIEIISKSHYSSQSNIGSQVVLVKNGFEFIGRTRQVIKINGEWKDGIIFEKIKG